MLIKDRAEIFDLKELLNRNKIDYEQQMADIQNEISHNKTLSSE